MMCKSANYRRGGVLRGIAWIAVALGAFVLVTALFMFRGGKIQQELQETGQKLKEQYPGLKEKLAELPDLPESSRRTDRPQTPDNAPPPAGDKPVGDQTPAQKTSEQKTVPEPVKPEPAPEPAYSVEDPPPVARARHKVGKGETLYSLAETYYEDGSLWKLIARANDLKSPADLREGMVVTIPGK